MSPGWDSGRAAVIDALPGLGKTTAAAFHLGAYQSALIHQFRRLERDIGAPLYLIWWGPAQGTFPRITSRTLARWSS
jgi:hypothetical protein